jgi:hypothetical protein
MERLFKRRKLSTPARSEATPSSSSSRTFLHGLQNVPLVNQVEGAVRNHIRNHSPGRRAVQHSDELHQRLRKRQTPFNGTLEPTTSSMSSSTLVIDASSSSVDPTTYSATVTATTQTSFSVSESLSTPLEIPWTIAGISPYITASSSTSSYLDPSVAVASAEASPTSSSSSSSAATFASAGYSGPDTANSPIAASTVPSDSIDAQSTAGPTTAATIVASLGPIDLSTEVYAPTSSITETVASSTSAPFGVYLPGGAIGTTVTTSPSTTSDISLPVALSLSGSINIPGSSSTLDITNTVSTTSTSSASAESFLIGASVYASSGSAAETSIVAGISLPGVVGTAPITSATSPTISSEASLQTDSATDNVKITLSASVSLTLGMSLSETASANESTYTSGSMPSNVSTVATASGPTGAIVTGSVASYTASGVVQVSTGSNATIPSASSTNKSPASSGSTASTSRTSSLSPSFARNFTTTLLTTFNKVTTTSTSSSSPLAAILGFFTASTSTLETLSDNSLSTATLAAQAFATTLSNGETTTSYGSFLPVSTALSSVAVSESASGYAALTGNAGISSASAALSSPSADISSRLSSLSAIASTATGSARDSYSSQFVVLQSSASSALRVSKSALSSATSRVSSDGSSASASPDPSGSSLTESSFASTQASETGLPATATASSSTNGTGSSSSGNDDGTPPPSVLAGGIVGGVAGLAVLVLTAMIFVRWYQKRAAANMLALTGAEAAAAGSGAEGMSERGTTAPVLAPLLGGVFKSRKSQPVSSDTGERGFQRLSGRKLPSAFSAGMTSAPPMAMPSAFDIDRTMSTRSMYRDSNYYGAAGSPFDDPDNEVGINETIMPSPARQPRVHHPYPITPTSAMSETASPTSPTFSMHQNRNLLSPEPGQSATLIAPLSPQGTANNHRSVTPSFDGSRGSRFTEEV